MTKDQLDGELAELGFDLETNKALQKYFNSGMQGVMVHIHNAFESDEQLILEYSAWERKAMTILVYNRAMNGAKIPGCPQYMLTGGNMSWDGLTTHIDAAKYRKLAFKEVQRTTLERWNAAINLIDAYNKA